MGNPTSEGIPVENSDCELRCSDFPVQVEFTVNMVNSACLQCDCEHFTHRCCACTSVHHHSASIDFLLLHFTVLNQMTHNPVFSEKNRKFENLTSIPYLKHIIRCVTV